VDTEDVRLAVYRSFVATGAAPTVAALADELGATPDAVREALAALHRARHLVLDTDTTTGATGDRIVMAHPFTSVPLGFSVMGADTLWWGGCAWDAFATPHVLPDEDEVLVATSCPACGAAHAWVVGTAGPPAGEQRAHFLVPTAHMWDDVVHTCAHQRLFCDDACIDAWLDRTGNERGYVMDLATLWRFAAHWYDGRLTRGYVRREPEQAREYFAEVGLTGPFWGLPGPPT
jgi:Alkylmercury lyase